MGRVNDEARDDLCTDDSSSTVLDDRRGASMDPSLVVLARPLHRVSIDCDTRRVGPNLNRRHLQ